ncbi:MAG: hypothetical protein QOD55_2217 [Solirubrobacteraceae bacterium]|nr:hypothetical protein [Solirubrobacteraceae bacterium]
MAEQRQREARFERARDDAWRYERFLTTIREQTGLDRDHAERAAMAVLVTLAERISPARAQELAEDLPERLRVWLQDAGEKPETFHIEEFVRRVADREEVDTETAARHARAVFRAVTRVAPAYEIDDLVDELPHEYEPLVGDVARAILESTEPEVPSFDAFVERVKRRADLDRLEAERAAESVLETLAERLVAGEVEDLQAVLPERFRAALERGKVRGQAKPRRMSLDEFVDRVAGKEEVSFDEAFRHTQAVFATLAEALPPRELRDILHELPRGYRETLF